MTFTYPEYDLGLECSKHADSTIIYVDNGVVSRYLPQELFAPTIQIAWQSSDQVRWNAPATSTPTSSITRPSNTVSTIPTSTSSPSGLSNGAKAGIGVGAAAAGLLLVAAIVFFVWRRRTQARNNAETHHDVVPVSNQPEAFHDDKRQSGLTGMQEHQSPPQSFPSPSPAYQSPPQDYQISPQVYQSPPQEYYQASKSEVFRHVAERSVPAELETGWRGWEASTGNPVGTNGGDQIHAQGATGYQDLPEVSSTRR